ncbi:WD40 repeat domain-containing protein [Candidatus Albibeggiatoa sp. nov. NOAA]|uniref:WD40 repeat domain-containing protein n=1 Tax=Candidatus Albibeggiatoa sp. nov. NOAA TaxID=3162724 RepID=UPI003304ACA0|nr:WD40 repeat domain-containing protein [Thiotrichaceae bacterium]
MKNTPNIQSTEFNLGLPTGFPFAPDASETLSEFKQRLRVILRHPIIAGHAQLNINQYNLLSQMLPIQVTWEQWAQPFQDQVGDIHLCVQEAQIQQLKSTQSYPIYAQLKLVENGNKKDVSQHNIIFKIKVLHLKAKNHIVPIHHQLPPTLLYSLEAHTNWTKAVSFTQHDSLLLASASEDNTIHLWDMGSGRQPNITLEAKSGVNSIAFSPDGKLLASGSNDTLIRLWNVETGQEQHILQGHEFTVFSVAFSPNGQVLASGSVDKTVRLWDVQTGRELFTLRGHDSWVFSVAFSPDGKTLASGSRDKTVKLWDVSNGNELLTLPHQV